MPGREERGLVIAINAMTNWKAYRRLPAQPEAAWPPPVLCNVGHITQRSRRAQQAPHRGLHFHFYEYFSELPGGGFCQV